MTGDVEAGLKALADALDRHTEALGWQTEEARKQREFEERRDERIAAGMEEKNRLDWHKENRMRIKDRMDPVSRD